MVLMILPEVLKSSMKKKESFDTLFSSEDYESLSCFAGSVKV